MKVNLRMNLSHFLNKPYEEEVINKLGIIHKDSIKYYLTLWYEDGILKGHAFEMIKIELFLIC